MNNSKQKKLLRWFYPGRHVKRFLLLSALGVIIASLALAVFVILATMSIDKGQVAFLLQDLSRYIPRFALHTRNLFYNFRSATCTKKYIWYHYYS